MRGLWYAMEPAILTSAQYAQGWGSPKARKKGLVDELPIDLFLLIKNIYDLHILARLHAQQQQQPARRSAATVAPLSSVGHEGYQGRGLTHVCCIISQRSVGEKSRRGKSGKTASDRASKRFENCSVLLGDGGLSHELTISRCKRRPLNRDISFEVISIFLHISPIYPMGCILPAACHDKCTSLQD